MPTETPDFQKKEQHDMEILCVKEVARFIKRSKSWVYQNYEKLGGVNVGSSLFFPSKEEIYERLFQQKKGVVGVLFPPQQNALHRSGIQAEKTCSGSGGGQKEGGKTAAAGQSGENRHGLLDVIE
ncbi:MAG: hypothetical protein ACQETC_01325 [Thermodesulfobacteriota bacterium]